ncbi:phosphoribosyl-ATP pyrophosphohydrolase [Heyndrickxia sp. MSNUG]|uniref:phosphoribosyl-ATP pyrophosphohydrolase n=1 Tax=Heyndrickxia sp. MSNUG TaxID=3136677 RepID=UPI003C2FC5F5
MRNQIPEIIKNDGKIPNTRTLREEEFLNELRKKAFEELNEYMEANTNATAIEELADLLEIIHMLYECHGGNINEVEEVRIDKFMERGGFKEKIFLIDVKEKSIDYEP